MRRDLGIRGLTGTDHRISGGARRLLLIAILLTVLLIISLWFAVRSLLHWTF